MIATLPRGGWRAGALDRWYETAAPEFLDRDDVPERCRARVLTGLHRFHSLTGSYRQFTRWVLRETDESQPRLLELGAGHGALSEHLAAACPTARVTVSDVAPAVVASLRRRLGAHPRIDVAAIDAANIDAAEGSWDVAVLALTLHHFSPPTVVRVIEEATRVARALVVIDVWRHPLTLAAVPVLPVLGGWPLLHDGVISLRKMYSAAALRDLVAAANAPLSVTTSVHLPGYLRAVIRRAGPGGGTGGL